ncbi:hypothetical protein AVEN_50655-1 [Araneus ventricosus]|uniref:Uncharacterized protein n=1 Tax=Araneus ventricosus TaxID=182803 RepID=A0A4Y2AQI0_ARAVE|nr:hypothetical protein AVEN_50655-1 [Araneus ventricosus]
MPLSTSPEGNTMLAMFNRVFKCLESIQKDIKVMKAEQIKIQSQLSEMCNQEGPVKNLPTATAALKFKEAGREELAEKFGRVLASACDWEGSRLNKKTSECAENIYKLC